MKNAYLAGGCFWCIANVFSHIDGVKKVVSGYCGGEEINPTYEEVKSQKTKHRETIKVIYDENIISYEDILKIYLRNVDPFDNGGQFIDRGYSYTLAIYYETEEELFSIKKLLNLLTSRENKIVYISCEKFKTFYEAEDYHQDFAMKNPEKFAQELIESGRKKN